MVQTLGGGVAGVSGEIDVANRRWPAEIGFGQMELLASLPLSGGLVLGLDFRLAVPNRLDVGDQTAVFVRR